jgi:electron transport complex protein RnfC
MDTVLTRPSRSFAHGVHPPENKEATEDKVIRRLPFPSEMIIPLSQHIGAPAKPIVRVGQEVVRGEPIAEPGGFVSVPMHAPATGVVSRIDLAQDARGQMVPSIYIKLYAGSSQAVLYGAHRDIDALSPQELVKAVQSTGVVGLGGAAFPTHVKLAVPEGKTIDTVIVNGCECEPYLTTDHRVMLEQAAHIFDGIRVVLRATGAKEAIIGIESNKPDAIQKLSESIPAGLPVRVVSLRTKYPQGAEKILSKVLAQREVPSGGLPSDVGVACFNVATLAQIGELLPESQGLIERVVTITGPGVMRPGNYLMPLGAPLRFVLEQVGFTGSAKQVILGGPMMGASVSSLDVPITKGVSGILVMTEEEVRRRPDKIFPCIRCGACVQACPLFLNPSRLGILAQNSRYTEMATQFHLNDCFECGSCTYVCPSNIPLVQYFRIGKAVNRERQERERNAAK